MRRHEEQKTNNHLSAKNLLSKVVGQGSQVPKIKVDSSLVYQQTQRREWSMTFELAQVYGDAHPSQSVFEPIQRLQSLSCPEFDSNLVSIKWPAIFQVSSSPSNIIQCRYAVLTAVQPSFHGPYKDGFPTSCSLVLSWTDLEPLYRSSFKS